RDIDRRVAERALDDRQGHGRIRRGVGQDDIVVGHGGLLGACGPGADTATNGRGSLGVAGRRKYPTGVGRIEIAERVVNGVERQWNPARDASPSPSVPVPAAMLPERFIRKLFRAVTATELVDAAAGIDDLVLAGIERMRLA